MKIHFTSSVLYFWSPLEYINPLYHFGVLKVSIIKYKMGRFCQTYGTYVINQNVCELFFFCKNPFFKFCTVSLVSFGVQIYTLPFWSSQKVYIKSSNRKFFVILIELMLLRKIWVHFYPKMQ